MRLQTSIIERIERIGPPEILNWRAILEANLKSDLKFEDKMLWVLAFLWRVAPTNKELETPPGCKICHTQEGWLKAIIEQLKIGDYQCLTHYALLALQQHGVN